jgi:hypothetical protein
MNKKELTEEELTDVELIMNKFNLCYPIIRDNDYKNIYWIYDEEYIKTSVKNKVNGYCLFEQNIPNNFLWCDNDMIWSIIKKYIMNDKDTQTFIKKYFYNNNKLSEYNTVFFYTSFGVTTYYKSDYIPIVKDTNFKINNNFTIIE